MPTWRRRYSDDPGSKDQGGELPLIPTAQLDPAYAKAAMALNPGQTSGLVKSQFGYHIIQTEQKQAAGVKPLAEVKDSIVSSCRAAEGGCGGAAVMRRSLRPRPRRTAWTRRRPRTVCTSVTTDYVAKDGVIGEPVGFELALLAAGVHADKGAAPQRFPLATAMRCSRWWTSSPPMLRTLQTYKAHILDDYRAAEDAGAAERSRLIKLADRAKVLNDLKKAAAEMKLPSSPATWWARTRRSPTSAR